MTPFSVVHPVRKIQAVKCCLFESVKALAQTALTTQVEAWSVGFCEVNLLAKQSPEKVTRDHVYSQNGYETRSRDRRSTLVDKQINQMTP